MIAKIPMKNTTNMETEADPDVGKLAERIVLGRLLPTVGATDKGAVVTGAGVTET